MLPAVSITKNVFTTDQAAPSTVGILAILAASSTGTVGVVGGFARTDLAVGQYGYGPLTEYAAYDINVAGKPVVLEKLNATYPGSVLSQSLAMGSSTATFGYTSGITPYDHYTVVITFVTGGTTGVAGITYTYSLDGGQTVSGVQALGTSFVLTIPNTGISLTFTNGSIAAGATITAYTERPLGNDTDVTNGLNTLGNSRLPFEGILIDSSATSSTVGLVDTILAGWEARGVFRFALINTRYKLEPEPLTETEAAYATAIGATFANSTSIRQCVGADGAHAPSVITGWNLKRPTSMFLAARAMLIPIGEDPAFVERGPLTGAQITDNNSNPLDHDEDLYPGLDALRFTTLRSFAPGGPQGVYIDNANTIQPTGGAFPYLQFIRVMNQACTVCWQVLTTQLSRGVRKNPKKDPVTGAVTIFEPDAASIEALANEAMVQPLKGQVSDFKFSVSRTDDLSAVPAVVNGMVSLVAEAYIKEFAVQAQFTKTIQTSA